MDNLNRILPVIDSRFVFIGRAPIDAYGRLSWPDNFHAGFGCNRFADITTVNVVLSKLEEVFFLFERQNISLRQGNINFGVKISPGMWERGILAGKMALAITGANLSSCLAAADQGDFHFLVAMRTGDVDGDELA